MGTPHSECSDCRYCDLQARKVKSLTMLQIRVLMDVVASPETKRLDLPDLIKRTKIPETLPAGLVGDSPALTDFDSKTIAPTMKLQDLSHCGFVA
ncbi:hypothetical protein TcasGA2_TC013991 [Tribolium castaneum]|uniref:Uncharacterized protein n=1 Tax=Tribolium castaneum TaxID=7070 RepID=D6WJ11_TRICA|nr:hypothetical protein TcasGA2_TC013991 [Tribolium castaneum]